VFGGFDRVMAQSEADATRLRSLGAAATADGNLKFAAPPLPVCEEELTGLRALIRDRPVWLAACTHPGEEAVAGAVHAALVVRHPRLLTIVAPRHPERGAEIAATLSARRRAAGDHPPGDTGIWVADTMGELGLLYRLAPVVFMGGSLVPHGGQNPLEPARLGCAVAVGPHTFNFLEPVAALADTGGLMRVADQTMLARWVDEMLSDPLRRAACGEAARSAASRSSDLPDLVASVLASLLRREAVPA
jgi:3-deoxy-D-manno-octulosonic-acid transferase